MPVAKVEPDNITDFTEEEIHKIVEFYKKFPQLLKRFYHAVPSQLQFQELSKVVSEVNEDIESLWNYTDFEPISIINTVATYNILKGLSKAGKDCRFYTETILSNNGVLIPDIYEMTEQELSEFEDACYAIGLNATVGQGGFYSANIE